MVVCQDGWPEMRRQHDRRLLRGGDDTRVDVSFSRDVVLLNRSWSSERVGRAAGRPEHGVMPRDSDRRSRRLGPVRSSRPDSHVETHGARATVGTTGCSANGRCREIRRSSTRAVRRPRVDVPPGRTSAAWSRRPQRSEWCVVDTPTIGRGGVRRARPTPTTAWRHREERHRSVRGRGSQIPVSGHPHDDSRSVSPRP